MSISSFILSLYHMGIRIRLYRYFKELFVLFDGAKICTLWHAHKHFKKFINSLTKESILASSCVYVDMDMVNVKRLCWRIMFLILSLHISLMHLADTSYDVISHFFRTYNFQIMS